jgi:metal-dependent amidase/aminoacylase/carboxypeptidase family protein
MAHKSLRPLLAAALAASLQPAKAAPAKIDESRRTGVPLPSLHSSKFAPVPEPTIKTGIAAMTAAALDLLAKN